MTEPRTGTAVVHGRFQPLHIGHMEYLMAGYERCRTLIVGITNPDPWQIRPEPTAPHRADPEANPFTFYERLLMVDGALREYGADPEAFRIVPFPHAFPERIEHYIPHDAKLFITIYDAWGEEKLRRFQGIGRDTEVLWRRTETVTSGTDIRQRIKANLPWRHLVPSAVASVVEQTIDRKRALHG